MAMIPTQSTTYDVYVLALLRTLTHPTEGFNEDSIDAMALLLDDLNRGAESIVNRGFKMLSGTDFVGQELMHWGKALGSNRPQRAMELLGDVELRLLAYDDDTLDMTETVIGDLKKILELNEG